MRPHRIEITAFGPFAGTEIVDLDALGAAGLFLLHGQTGAGKTTVLDAIGYALYGRVPGARQQARRWRSDHASPELRTRVCLEVTLQGRRFEIARCPEWERSKRRGSGTTRDPAKVALRESVDGAWRFVSDRVGEVDAELRRLVGLDCDQFFQVVLLPQGEFARFLRAGADERRAVLETLFSTSRFAAVEEWLVERRRAAAHEVETAAQELSLLAARVVQAAGCEQAPDPADLTEAWLEGIRADWSLRRDEAVLAAKRAEAVVTRRRDEMAAAEDLARRQQRRREALAREQGLAGEVEAAAAAIAERDGAQRATGVVGALDARDRAEGVLRRAREADRLSRAELAAAGVDARDPLAAVGDPDEAGGGSVDESAALRERAAGLRAELGQLGELARQEEQLAADRRELVGLERGVAVSEEELAAARQTVDELPAHRQALEAERQRAQAAAEGLPAAEQAVTEAVERLTARRDLDAERLVAAQLAEAAETARGAHQDRRQEWLDLRERRIDGMAAELADKLAPDTPCPVCGALEHPDPSEAAPDAVSRAEEQEASRIAHEAEGAAEQARRAGEESATRCATLRGRLGNDLELDADELASRVEDLQGGLRARREDAAGLEERAAALAAADERQRIAEEAVVRVTAELAGQRERAERLRESVAGGRTRLADTLGGDASVAARAERLEVLADAYEAVARTAEALVSAARGYDEASAAASAAAAEAGFADVAAAVAARRSPEQLAQLRDRTERRVREEAAVNALLADSDLDVALEPRTDVDGVRRAAEVAEAAAQQATVVAADARRVCDELAALGTVLVEKISALGPVRETAAEVASLANLCTGRGDNTLRMRLSAFVLAARLEEVAAVASQRLSTMTAGRYALVHTDAVSGARRSGLGLLVRDGWTGRDRETATLSGGETFLASLALALALADVVTAEAGGTPVDTLFVDEGFGTLDEDTLEEVMDVLDGLRQGGRVVGLVSHVPELRQRIPAQLRVRKGRSGSTISLHGV